MEGGDTKDLGEGAGPTNKEAMTHDNQNTTLDARSFLGSYLKTADLDRPIVATIIDARGELLEGKTKPSLIVEFEELPKAMVVNPTNIKVLMEVFGTQDVNQWRGPIGLYVDPNVEFGGKRTGGLRVTSARSIRPQRANGSAGQQPRYDHDPEEYAEEVINF